MLQFVDLKQEPPEKRSTPKRKDDFNEIIALINKYKIIQDCYQKAQHYINLASNSLSVFKDSKEKTILKNLTSFSLARNF